MSEQIEQPPQLPESQTPTGLVAAFAGRLEKRRGIYGQEVINGALANVRTWAEAARPGESIITFDDNDNTEGFVVVGAAGTLSDHLYATYSLAQDTMYLCAPIGEEVLVYPDLFLVQDRLRPSFSRIAIGHEDCRNKLQALGLHGARPEEPSLAQITVDIHTLHQLAVSGFAINDYYDLTDDERVRLCERLNEGIFSSNHISHQGIVALAAVIGLTADEQPRLMDAIYDQLAGTLPVTPEESYISMFSVMQDLAPARAEPLFQDHVLRGQYEFGMFVHDLYMRRARQLSDEPTPAPLEIPSTYEIPTAVRHISLFDAQAKANEVRTDVLYLRARQVAGQPATELDRNHTNMRTVVDKITHHIMANENAVERAEAMLALEYILGLQDNAQRSHFYELMANRVAKDIPVHRAQPMQSYIRIAQTMAELAPPLRTEPDVPLPQPARTAAMLALFYQTLASHMHQRDQQLQ